MQNQSVWDQSTSFVLINTWRFTQLTYSAFQQSKNNDQLSMASESKNNGNKYFRNSTVDYYT